MGFTLFKQLQLAEFITCASRRVSLNLKKKMIPLKRIEITITSRIT